MYLRSFTKFPKTRRPLVTVVVVIVCLIVLICFKLVSAPKNFPVTSIFSIESGSSLEYISQDLSFKGYIRSPLVFKIIVKGLFSSGNKSQAGEYLFEHPESSIKIARRIINAEFNLVPVRVTIPEGLTKFETAEILKKNLIGFDDVTFLEKAPEGYLFPDTYFLTPNASPETVIQVLADNFNKKIETIQEEIDESGRSLSDIVIMASIIETEARQTETRRTIAGILWDRLDDDMPLQVDVSWKYINGKNTYELTEEDLSIDSPYNTYIYKGLPPTPVASPGLDALTAAVTPIETKYVYFLSDRGGEMYYAVTFEEHKENKRKYLHIF